MDLLPLLDEGVVLGDALEGELLHEVDLVGVAHVLAHEALDGEGEGGRVEEDLADGGQVGDQAVEHPLEVLREQLVRLVQAQDFALVNIGDLRDERDR